MEKLTPKQVYVQLYDVWVQDWPGEVDFYREMIALSPLKSSGILEIACGTGRITLQLAEDGNAITGLDVSPEFLEIAREKSAGTSNLDWVLGDMRTFELGKKYGFVISPGHSFQFMTTPDDQVQCLEQIRRHLVPDGIVVLHIDHQNFGWLAGLLNEPEPVYKKSDPLRHPQTHQVFRRSYRWEFESHTQTATARTNWEEVNEKGDVIQVWEMEPARLHCIFPFEMEHLLNRAGFSVEADYGDFYKNALTGKSEQMIWVARNKTAGFRR